MKRIQTDEQVFLSRKYLERGNACHIVNLYIRLKPAVHYTTFVGRRADGRLNTRNRIVSAYRQQTSAVGTTAFNTSRPDSKNESGRLM